MMLGVSRVYNASLDKYGGSLNRCLSQLKARSRFFCIPRTRASTSTTKPHHLSGGTAATDHLKIPLHNGLETN